MTSYVMNSFLVGRVIYNHKEYGVIGTRGNKTIGEINISKLKKET